MKKSILLKHVIETIINIYEATISAPLEEEGLNIFYCEMERLYLLLFTGASSKIPYPIYDPQGSEKRFCDYNMYFESENDKIVFKLEKCIYDYRDVMRLLGGLKQELIRGKSRPIYNLKTSITSVKDFDGKLTTECERKVYCDFSKYFNKHETKDTYDFAKSYVSLSDNPTKFFKDNPEEGAIIFDFWDYPWESFIYFCASALVTYYSSEDAFSRIRICEKCGKMHIPKRSGKKRGVFCSTMCQKSYYNMFHKRQITCIQKQRQYLKTRFDYLKTSYSGQADVTKCIPAIDICKKCQYIIAENVKSGMCPELISSVAVRELNDAYICLKRINKNNNKK